MKLDGVGLIDNRPSTTLSNRKNPPIQKNRHNLWTSNAILMSFKIKILLKNCNIVYFMTESTIFNY